MKNKKLLFATLILGIIIIGMGGFFAGLRYQRGKQLPWGQFREGMRIQNGLKNQPQRIGRIRGEIISRDEKSITVKLPDNSSKIIFISENTEIIKASKGSNNDLEIGKQVIIFGKENSDKTILAESVQINPLFQSIQKIED